MAFIDNVKLIFGRIQKPGKLPEWLSGWSGYSIAYNRFNAVIINVETNIPAEPLRTREDKVHAAGIAFLGFCQARHALNESWVLDLQSELTRYTTMISNQPMLTTVTELQTEVRQLRADNIRYLTENAVQRASVEDLRIREGGHTQTIDEKNGEIRTLNRQVVQLEERINLLEHINQLWMATVTSVFTSVLRINNDTPLQVNDVRRIRNEVAVAQERTTTAQTLANATARRAAPYGQHFQPAPPSSASASTGEQSGFGLGSNASST